MARTRLYIGEHWPVLFVDQSDDPLDGSRIAYDVDDAALVEYRAAELKFLLAQRALLESIDISDPNQLMESEMRTYLHYLPKE